MPKLKLAELAQIAEIVAAVAVVASLIYVGMEVRSNTSAIQGATMQAIATSDAAALMTIASSAELSEIVRQGNQDASQLTPADAFRYGIFMRQFWLSFQNIHQQSELGLIDSSVWQSYVSVICGMWTHPGVQNTWPNHLNVLEPSFVIVVEACESR